MATLHMNTEELHNLSNFMHKTVDDIQTKILQLNSKTVNAQAEWMGISATNYFSSFNQWTSKMGESLQELENLSNQLQQEISEWESMASKLS